MANANLSHPAERAVSLSLEAEVMADCETGALSLVASADPQLTDFAEVSPARLREMVAAARRQLAEFERLADEQDARNTLAALLAEHRMRIEEWDVSTLDSRLRDRIDAVHDPLEQDGRIIIVPAGQDPVVRLAAVRRLIAGLGGAA
jgi:hypothetical protein